MKTTLLKLFYSSLITFILLLLVLLGTAQTVQTFTASGSWVCPYGVTSITVETWGGGGGGGAAPVNSSVGGGGGGGAYLLITTVPVTFGTNYNFIVGAGGAGNSTGAGANGIASSFNGMFTASPGTGGGSNASLASGGTGGTGGTFNGGNGAQGSIAPARSGGGGGGAGSGGNGGSTLTNAAGTAGGVDGGAGGTGVTSNTDGGNAAVIGGGGGGALRNGGGGAKKGGNGARGQVQISYTINCTAPPAQPTGFILSPSSNSISGSFTAAAFTDGYIVIRTSTSTAPSSPVDGTTYTAGTAALGGFIESVGTVTAFNSTSLAATTQYWYWVYGYNNVSCVGGIRYLTASPLTGNSTTVVCGALTNTATITSLAGALYNSSTNTWVLNWSALSWSLGLPTACQNVNLIVDRSAATVAENININLDANVSIKNLLMRNISNTPFRIVFQISSPTTGAFDILIDGTCTIECPGGTVSNKFNRCSILNNGRTTINGDLTLGRIPSLTATNEGHSSIGSGNATVTTFPNQILTFYGNITFNPRGFTVDEHTVFAFNKAGTQYIYNFTRPLVSDTSYPILFEDLRIGTTNATNLIMAGTLFDGYIEYAGRAGITIGVNSTFDLPANYSMNVIKGGLPVGTGLPSFLKMLAGSKLRLGGNASVLDVYGFAHGVAGSNFPGFISPYILDATSTIEYYGSNSITQTIFNAPAYANLVITNGSGSGRAIKQTTAGTLTVNNSFNINALADVYLGTATGLGTNTAPVTSNGPLNINATGGLYCNANVVSGTGAFTMGAGSFLGMGHPQGISNTGSATGNIQMTAGRSYNSTGNYIYNGLVNQITGVGLPSGAINDLTIDNPTTVTIATNQLVNGVALLKQGTFDIGSTKIIHNGVGILNSTGGKMKANLGIVEMKGTSGTAQNLSGSWFVNKTISSLINSNTTGITVAAPSADTLLISSALLYGATNSFINTNSNLTLLSRDTATARFGSMVDGNSITGQVNIERYLPAKKSWRLLAAPVTNATSPFVTAAWREGGGSLASTGYGTRITGPAGFVGVDEYTQRASMKYYDPMANNYIDVANTTTHKISNTTGYYVFVRGDRSVAIAGAAEATILRIKGNINTGTQTVPVPAGKFISLGNPYPSKIDFRTMVKTNIASSFIVWNPNSLGVYNVGAFETYTLNAGDYKKVPGGTIRNFIESGEAIFIQSNGSAGSITIAETDKAGGTSLPVSRSGATTPTLEINMYTKNPDGTAYLADGILMNFNDGFSSSVDNNDVRKIINAGDNLFLKTGAANLVVESRPMLKVTDTIKLSLTNTRINRYRFEIDPSAIPSKGLKAMLKDKFLGSETKVSLSTITNYNFDITPDAASRVTDRFMIVFKQKPRMNFKKITAFSNADETATVKWYIENENNIHTYKIEQSVDGINFSEIGDQMPTANSSGNPCYSFVTTRSTNGNSWYRIKAISFDNAVTYSDMASVLARENELPTTTTIYPNPVTDGKVNVSFVNEPSGKYQLTITNMAGQNIYTEMLELKSKNLQKTISLSNKAAGSYQLIVKSETGNSKKISFLIK